MRTKLVPSYTNEHLLQKRTPTQTTYGALLDILNPLPKGEAASSPPVSSRGGTPAGSVPTPANPPARPAVEPAQLSSPTIGVLAGFDFSQRVLRLQPRDRSDIISFTFDEATTVTAVDGSARLLIRSEGRALDNLRSVRLQWAPDPADGSRRLISRITAAAR